MIYFIKHIKFKYFIPNEIDIFPNPFSNTTTIELPNNDSYILSVYDITVNIVKTEQVSGKFLMERENMTKGLYFIDLSSDKNTFKGKVIVK